MSGFYEYKKNVNSKATIQDVVNIVNATLHHHIQVRHKAPWYRRALARLRAPRPVPKPAAPVDAP